MYIIEILYLNIKSFLSIWQYSVLFHYTFVPKNHIKFIELINFVKAMGGKKRAKKKCKERNHGIFELEGFFQSFIILLCTK